MECLGVRPRDRVGGVGGAVEAKDSVRPFADIAHSPLPSPKRMSAPHLYVFLPNEANGDEVFDLLVAGLSLTIDVWPTDRPPALASSAQTGPVTSYALIERYVDSKELIGELVQWQRPGGRYKDLLAKCVEHI